MSLLGTYLWKEWREQRAALGLLALGLAVVTAILGVMLTREAWVAPVTSDWVVGMSLATALFTVGSDLLPRDLRREPRQFLERAPAGLFAAFFSKLVFFIAVMLVAGIFGVLLASITTKARTGELPVEFLAMKHPGRIFLIAITVVCWVFAVSAWVSTSAMAAPAGLVFLGLCAWPWWFGAWDFTTVWVGAKASTPLIVLVAVGGLVTASWSFIVGASRSRRRRAVVFGGMGMALLFFLPSWALAGARYSEWKNAGFAISRGWVGPGERFAFLNLGRRNTLGLRFRRGDEVIPLNHGRMSAFLLDLETRSWAWKGERDHSSFSPPHGGTGHGFLAGSRISMYEPDREPDAWFDARTGLRIDPDQPLVPNSDITLADFGLESSPRSYMLGWAGLGHSLHIMNREEEPTRLYLDPARELIVDLAALLPEDVRSTISSVRILPDRWLVREAQRWRWLDPVSGGRADFDRLGEGECFLATIDDGTLLIRSAEKILRLDPVNGERRALRILGAPDLLPRIAGITMGGLPRAGMPLPAGSDVAVSVLRNFRPNEIALLDLTAGTLRFPAEAWDLPDGIQRELLCNDGPRAIVIEGVLQIVRYDFATEEREVIFDVEQLDGEYSSAEDTTR